ncbi:6-phosphogluconolactonase [Natranaerovirga hydrolytica]|uniref:6-phosphogluconolactonase n=1 Tax=Natranaerovirga hydrolytica TaxID=680378 RepID=A0A4R1MRQ2_9FIRM|nr:lactonase family protein [Natranaerovirga hydrolytica]TCK93249.1 6-phosphogluconolactonase [Natranaerovirga hydrolytica]
MNAIIAYIGTYTEKDSQGIYKAVIDPKTKVIQSVELATEIKHPTYLSVTKDANYLYTISMSGENGSLSSFQIDSDFNLKSINSVTIDGPPNSHIHLDSTEEHLLCANYRKGAVEIYPIQPDKSLGEPSTIRYHEGKGPHKKRQKQSHVHYITSSSDNKYIYTLDLGADMLVVYEFKNGTITLDPKRTLPFKSGSGPRHLSFHPQENYAYVLCELTSEINVLEYNSKKNKFTIIQTLSTLPKDFKKENLGSAIHVSPDGNYLYASNRGHNSIVCYKIQDNIGTLKLLSHTDTLGELPRDFNIHPSGEFLIASNLESNTLVSFEIDKASGHLTPVGQPIKVPSPSCVKFVN